METSFESSGKLLGVVRIQPGRLPAIWVPCGFSRSGLPTGLLVGGPALAEPRLLALALAYEQATDWHRRRPPLG
jgi:aspartyl-tRNA(Asn)/glutamyl-tRNA(Gln) amidotransferase subunit A